MASQQFSLKWNNHTSNMLSIFENLLSTETFVDVTLACDGLSLKAHKMVLSACSSFFQSLFLENPCKHPIVIMKDVNYKDLKAIVDFMYHGEVNVSQDQLSALLKTAETLKVKGLTEVSGGAQDTRDPAPQTAPPPQNVPIPSSSSTPLSHLQQNISDSSPMRAKRKRVRSRKRSSDSNASDDEIVPAKVKEPNSPEIEELMEEPSISVANNDSILRRGVHNSSRSSRHSSVQSQQSFSSKRHSASNAQVHQDQGSGEDEVEPSKLLVQTLTTETIPSSAVSSSNISLPMGSGIEISQVGDNQALVPVTTMSDSMSSSHFQGPDSPQDIKPVITFEDQIPGTSQSTMFIDQSSLPGPSGYEDNSMVSQEGQSQEIQELIVGKLNFLIKRINTLEEKIDTMRSVASVKPLNVSSEIMRRFPLKNDEQLVELEKFISDEENQKDLVINLKGIGGSDVYHVVTNILKRALTNEVAELYSWAGAKAKKSFKILHLSRTIFETTRVQFPNATEESIGHHIANWLRHAKQRKIRAEGTPSARLAHYLEQN